MRINNRFIKHAPKRSPDELNIELKKLKIIQIKRAIHNLSKTIADAINGIKNAIVQAWEAISSTVERIADALPSVRRFEHNLI